VPWVPGELGGRERRVERERHERRDRAPQRLDGAGPDLVGVRRDDLDEPGRERHELQPGEGGEPEEERADEVEPEVRGLSGVEREVREQDAAERREDREDDRVHGAEGERRPDEGEREERLG